MIPLRDDLPHRRFPLVTVGLIVLCGLVFLVQQGQDPLAHWRTLLSYGVVPAAVLGKTAGLSDAFRPIPTSLTLLTAPFLHGGWLHLFGNMLFLWIFGASVENAMSRLRFGAFYFLCGSAGFLAHALADPYDFTPVIGASGAIAGITGAYLLLYPRARILMLLPWPLFFLSVRAPAWLFVGLWFCWQVINVLLAASTESNVAWLAHLGGFATGMALIPLLKNRACPLFQPARVRRDQREVQAQQAPPPPGPPTQAPPGPLPPAIPISLRKPSKSGRTRIPRSGRGEKPPSSSAPPPSDFTA